jgi:hypothetical protein
MADVTNLRDFASKRAKAKVVSEVKSFAAHFSAESRQARFRHALLNLIDDHADLGATFLISELTGALIVAQVFEDKE